MASNVIPFRDPDLPLIGTERLVQRRVYRAACKTVAARTVARAFSESFKTSGSGKLSVEDAFPLFVAAMRRELRKSGLF